MTATDNHMPQAVEAAKARQHPLPKPWSNALIALAVLYCFLLLAGLFYTGWFKIA